MFPNLPYEGLSWPITQHAGVLSKESLDGLLNACIQCRGERANAAIINEYLVSHNILTPNIRADSNQGDAWRDYQQILSEFGLIYSARVSREIRLTPVAHAYLNRKISYDELITLQVMRYQYPNGHKSQLSPSLTESFGKSFNFSSFTELQAHYGILVHPAAIVWRVLYNVWEANELPILSIDEMQNYIIRCTHHSDIDKCTGAIIAARNHGVSLPQLTRARRNAADWLKVLNQTPLFILNSTSDTLSFSAFSVIKSKEVLGVTKLLSEPSSFWLFRNQSNYKEEWFDYYGDFDNSLDLIIKSS